MSQTWISPTVDPALNTNATLVGNTTYMNSNLDYIYFMNSTGVVQLAIAVVDFWSVSNYTSNSTIFSFETGTIGVGPSSTVFSTQGIPGIGFDLQM